MWTRKKLFPGIRLVMSRPGVEFEDAIFFRPGGVEDIGVT